jgi:hypothetical protein
MNRRGWGSTLLISKAPGSDLSCAATSFAVVCFWRCARLAKAEYGRGHGRKERRQPPLNGLFRYLQMEFWFRMADDAVFDAEELEIGYRGFAGQRIGRRPATILGRGGQRSAAGRGPGQSRRGNTDSNHMVIAWPDKPSHRQGQIDGVDPVLKRCEQAANPACAQCDLRVTDGLGSPWPRATSDQV